MIVNNIRAVRIPARVTDRFGTQLSDTAVKFSLISGDSVSLTQSGIVTCDRAADVTVRATLGTVSTNATLYCRPVEKVTIDAPIQFVLPGDPAQPLMIRAIDANGNEVSSFLASIVIRDTAIATFSRGYVIPRLPGSTVAGVRVGNRDAGAGVHVYQRVTTLDGLKPDQKLVAVPLELKPGETREWQIGRGGWMITMLPENDEANGARLRIQGAQCNPGFTRRRYVCSTKSGARIVVYHPLSTGSSPVLTGKLLVRRLDD